jgi:HK97 family phage major capsid protein
MITKLEMLNEVKKRKLETAKIMDLIATEKRSLTNVEQITVDSLQTEILDFETRMAELQTVVPKAKNQYSITGINTEDKFSLVSFFRNLKDNRNFNEVEKEVIELGKQSFNSNALTYRGTTLPFSFENRATLAAGTAGVGQELVPEEKFDLLMPLRAKSIFARMGATFLTNLVGTISVPVMSGSTAQWADENETAVDGKNGFTEVDFAPKRLTVFLPVSNLLLIQNTVDAEKKLQTDLVNAVNEKLENTLLSASGATSKHPKGIFYGATYANGGIQVTGATTWGKIVALETGINMANADVADMGYVLSPSVLGTAKTTAKAAGTVAGFIAEGSTINGFKYVTTTNMPTIGGGKGVLFGNFRDFYICMWSGMEVIVDNLTNAKQGITNYIINLYVDGGSVRDASFAKGTLA